MSRPKKPEEPYSVEFAAPAKLIAYLDDLVELQGFGTSRAEIARNFVWDEVNRLIESNRLKQR
jgi:hypothetical protein